MGMIGNPADNKFQRVTNDSYNGDGSTTAFTLSAEVAANTDIEVLVDNVQQSPYDGSYTASGTILTFSAAPQSGTNNIYVIYNIGHTFVTNTVGADNIQDGAVSANKIASGVIKTPEEAMTTPFGRRNRIINGNMMIDQRGSAGSHITSGSRAYAVDRWSCEKVGEGAFTFGQSSTAPTGFNYSLQATVTTADTSIAPTNIYWFEHRIEGYNINDLEFGTANAKTITLSFWVRSSLTGTYSVCLTSTGSKTFEYIINSADTWEYKTIQITGPTATYSPSSLTSGTGINFRFALAVSSNYAQAASSDWTGSDIVGSTNQVNWMNTLGNTFFITGVQLEVGSVATPFEHRSYGEELAACQRYYVEYRGTNNAYWMFSGITDASYLHISTGGVFPTEMRAAPSVTIYSASGDGYVDAYGRGQYGQGNAGATENTTTGFNVVNLQAGGGSATGNAGAIMRGGYRADAEL